MTNSFVYNQREHEEWELEFVAKKLLEDILDVIRTYGKELNGVYYMKDPDGTFVATLTEERVIVRLLEGSALGQDVYNMKLNQFGSVYVNYEHGPWLNRVRLLQEGQYG